MKPIHNILSPSGRSGVIQASDRPFPNSGGEVVAFPNCQLSIVNCTSSPSHSKFSALCSKFSYSQGFLYAPFGEITTEYNSNFGSDIIPKYSFNAKELDEETGMYYYEARYYKPPVFTSRDAMFEKYFWMSPYAYCANNPVKYVDPSGCIFGPIDRVAAARKMTGIPYKQEKGTLRTENTPEATAYMDCSEFVCRVLAADQITDGVKSMNSTELKDHFNNSGKFVHSEEAQVGDIAVWEGHVGIVSEVGENGKIKVIHARGEGKLSIENRYAIKPEEYKKATFYGYYRPKNETPDGKHDNIDKVIIPSPPPQTFIGPADPPKLSEKLLNIKNPITNLIGTILENIGY